MADPNATRIMHHRAGEQDQVGMTPRMCVPCSSHRSTMAIDAKATKIQPMPDRWRCS